MGLGLEVLTICVTNTLYRVRAFMRMTSVAASTAPQSGYQSELFRGFSSIGNKVNEIHTGVNVFGTSIQTLT
jgi:hypothetical protein